MQLEGANFTPPLSLSAHLLVVSMQSLKQTRIDGESNELSEVELVPLAFSMPLSRVALAAVKIAVSALSSSRIDE